MIEQLRGHRELTSRALRTLISDCAPHLNSVSPWGRDLTDRIVEFALRGKLIRGSLVAVGSEVFGRAGDPDIYRVAASVELIQSFLLVHDDIMDEDAVRRGEATVFEQYRLLGSDQAYVRPSRFGESMGICAGDVTMMMAVEGLCTTSLPAGLRIELVTLLSREIGDVGIAQMADVANGHSPASANEEEIMAVYRYKTGRYTFSLPLSLGALIADAAPADVESLARWGELQGIIFQIRDDQLGLLEEGEHTGKPAGSDVTADKQTLHRLRLLEAVPGTRWEHVAGYFGNPTGSKELSEIREALSDLGVLRGIEKQVDDLAKEAQAVLASISPLGEHQFETLTSIAEYNRSRRS